jgi:hypothetical protein
LPEPDDDLNTLLARAKAALGAEASDASKALIEARLQSVAAGLALEWILGDHRFESQGQQTEYWLARMFEELFPDEQPEATRLYLRFGLPLPRAQYVARLLLARRSAHWRQAARKEVVAALESFEAEARQAAKGNASQTVRYDISLSRGAYDELVVLYDRLVGHIAGQDRPSPPRRAPSSPTLVWFSVTADGVLKLLDMIRKEG